MLHLMLTLKQDERARVLEYLRLRHEAVGS
jgi:hypothetical protein